ncbi:MAG: hypothetical protein NC548_05515 [Lachnospiraceae bacterium]|nr:hypothetical protein [Lachnospiraceae bacterium]
MTGGDYTLRARIPYAKSELYGMAKSPKKHQAFVELMFDTLYPEPNGCDITDEKCMASIQTRIERSQEDVSKFTVNEVGRYELIIIHDKYPVLVHFNYPRKNVIADISVASRSELGLIFHIHDLREMLSYASIDDMEVNQRHRAQCIPGTKYYI